MGLLGGLVGFLRVRGRGRGCGGGGGREALDGAEPRLLRHCAVQGLRGQVEQLEERS